MDEATAEVEAARERPPARPAARKLVKWGIAAVVLLAVIVAGIYYWIESQHYVSTENAYVNANRIDIAAQVSGPIVAIHVRDQQQVKKGDLLVEIDQRPYRIAADSAQAQLELAYQTTSQESAAVAAARAQVTQRQAELRNAQSNERRVRDLIERKLISQQSAEAMITEAETAQAAVHAADANLQQALSALGEAGKRNATVRAAISRLDQANLDLEYTRITAPSGGRIANFGLRPGSSVQAGIVLFAIISDEEYWVDANFKETELDRIRPEQRATIEVDMYRHHEFHGVVESLSAGSGTAFSLLPAQNATGNWVKVTQRVPVRIRVLDPDPKYPLRVGTTATVRVTLEPG
ncbi:MAG TPA: HlyD family secretion protein [Steroidobacteraceae bacterium]|nr:HlyD family secretion protein [Steroidobacteraceae bacterium]